MCVHVKERVCLCLCERAYARALSVCSLTWNPEASLGIDHKELSTWAPWLDQAIWAGSPPSHSFLLLGNTDICHHTQLFMSMQKWNSSPLAWVAKTLPVKLFFILACQSMDTAIVTRYSDKPWAPLHPDFTVPVSRGPVFCCAPHSYSSLYVDSYSSLQQFVGARVCLGGPSSFSLSPSLLYKVYKSCVFEGTLLWFLQCREVFLNRIENFVCWLPDVVLTVVVLALSKLGQEVTMRLFSKNKLLAYQKV